MEDAGQVLTKYYGAVVKRDLASARACLADAMVFEGLFETYPDADVYMKTFAGLLQITVRLEVKKIISEGNDAVVLFELETKEPAPATVLVAEWHQVKKERSFTSDRFSTAVHMLRCLRAGRSGPLH